ncbi:MAG TPA: retropepsin-like aspartic protease, partial [Brevundimonas sp.]|nr:retropepsin-like aspartic protease [Brevundimonas sp.]
PADALPPISVLANLFTRVAAEVMINGRGPFSFVIDTGAGSTAVADTVAAELALPARDPLIVHGITAAARTDSVQVDRLTLSGVGFRNLRCPVISRGQLGADGLLGLDVLGQFRLGFNIEHQSVYLSGRGIRVLMGGERMSTGSRIRQAGIHSVRGRFGQLILTSTLVEGLPTAAFIDSGAQYSIGNNALRRAVAARRPEGLGRSRPLQLYGVTGQTLSADLARVDNIRLGRSRLGTTPLLFADLHCFETLELAGRPALLIGADLLGRFRTVTLDFPANTVDFEGLRRQATRTIEDELLL